MLADQRGSLETIAASDLRVRLLQEIEVHHGGGPCLDCFTTGEAVVTCVSSAVIGGHRRHLDG